MPRKRNPIAPCLTEGCENLVRKRGMCGYHYYQLYTRTLRDEIAKKKAAEFDIDDYWLWVKKEVGIL